MEEEVSRAKLRSIEKKVNELLEEIKWSPEGGLRKNTHLTPDKVESIDLLLAEQAY